MSMARTSGRPVRGVAAKAPAAAKPKRRGSRAFWLLAVIAVPIGILAVPTAILLAIGLIPTIVAFMVDRMPEKYLPITVGATNLAGIVPAGFELWTGGHTNQHAIQVATDPFNMATMWGAAAVGWAIYFTIPSLIASMVNFRNRSQVSRLQKKQRALVDEWGSSVSDENYDPMKELADRPSSRLRVNVQKPPAA